MGDYLSTDEIADKLDVPKRTVQRLIREGKLPAVRIGKEYRVHNDEFERFIVDAEKGNSTMYSPLKYYLLSVHERRVTLSLEEIEALLVTKLPISSRKYRSWYGNDHSHVQAKAWLDAGWKVEQVDIGKTVTFVRK